MKNNLTKEEVLLRQHFPLINNSDLAYLDNAATSQKPSCVLEAATNYYQNLNANPMRGLYELSVKATNAYEDARAKVARFIHAKSEAEIVFTRNASESLNLIAYSYGRTFLKEGDEMIVSILEHHSNLLPWQQVAKATGATLTYLECDMDGLITIDDLKKIISPKTKLLAITHISNVIGRENPISEFTKLAHENGAVVVLDASQSVPHIKVDVQALDVDFAVFSGHKMYAPMGIGALYGRKELLEKMPPFLFGGEMIEYVTREGATYAPVPHKFEAGTVNVAGAVGLGRAIDFIEEIGIDFIEKRELHLTELAFEQLLDYPYIKIVGSKKPEEHHGIICFGIEGVHSHDIGEILSHENIAIRAGHHCAQPLMKHLGMASSARASFAFYNSESEILRFTNAVKQLRGKMGYGD